MYALKESSMVFHFESSNFYFNRKRFLFGLVKYMHNHIFLNDIKFNEWMVKFND